MSGPQVMFMVSSCTCSLGNYKALQNPSVSCNRQVMHLWTNQTSELNYEPWRLQCRQLYLGNFNHNCNPQQIANLVHKRLGRAFLPHCDKEEAVESSHCCALQRHSHHILQPLSPIICVINVSCIFQIHPFVLHINRTSHNSYVHPILSNRELQKDCQMKFYSCGWLEINRVFSHRFMTIRFPILAKVLLLRSSQISMVSCHYGSPRRWQPLLPLMRLKAQT